MIGLTRRRFLSSALGSFATCVLPSKLHAAASHKDGQFRVILDPGHGGYDPGAIGLSGVQEKHVTLAAALELQTALEASGRYEVHLSRDTDTFLPLSERIRRAEALSAIAFVSIHADALSDHSIRGASIYTQAAEASDMQSAELAKRENVAGGSYLEGMNELPAEVVDILQSLMVRETRSLSRALQRQAIESLQGRVPLLHNPAREADFAVLRSSSVPSFLIEMGFLSNRDDERLLVTPDYRSKIIAGLRDTIDECVSCRLLQSAG